MITSQKVICSDKKHEKKTQLLTGIDTSMPIAGFDVVLIYDHQLDDNGLIRGLKKCLTMNPQFAGRLVNLKSDRPALLIDNQGVLFTSITYDKELNNYGRNRSTIFDEERLTSHIDPINFDENTPIFQITVSHFLNCSVLGLSLSHRFCDGSSFWNFLMAWSAIARGCKVEPLYGDRSTLVNITDISASPSKEFPVVCAEQIKYQMIYGLDIDVFGISASSLHSLRGKISHDESEKTFNQLLIMACIWRLINSSLELRDDETCPLILAYNIRKQLGLDKTYIGNAICLKYVERLKGDIDNLDLGSVVKILGELGRSISQNSLLEDLSFWTQLTRQKSSDNYLRKANFLYLNGGIMMNNVTGLPIYEINFGSGNPIWFDFPRCSAAEAIGPSPMHRFVTIVRNKGGDGGVDFHVGLPTTEMKNLRINFEKFNKNIQL